MSGHVKVNIMDMLG